MHGGFRHRGHANGLNAGLVVAMVLLGVEWLLKLSLAPRSCVLVLVMDGAMVSRKIDMPIFRFRIRVNFYHRRLYPMIALAAAR